jgi:membrane-bound lytic murein transglycosylase D
MRQIKIIIPIICVYLSLVFASCSPQRQVKAVPTPPQEGSKTINQESPGKESDEKTALVENDDKQEQSATPAEVLEQALEAYQEAQDAWEKADVDTALAALDEAYSQILKLKVTQESPVFQEKNDLRLLIARRIQEIYASHLIAVGNNHQTIPLVENKYVMREIRSFQTRERQYFLNAYQRSGKYIKMIRRILKEAGAPEDLAWIPMVESGFKVRAYSRARALGLWQFISSTGYRFGLKRNRWIDERMDPEKATQAAVKYLNELHSFFGDWTTALASYNCGEFRVQRLIRAQKINYFDNFWDLFTMLPRETARFVPRIFAALLIIKNPQKYGFELPEPAPPLKYEVINVSRPIRLATLSTKLGLDEKELANLNPELRHQSTPDGEYMLKVPANLGKQALALIASMPKWIPPQATYIIHYVRMGETVSGIARRYRTSVRAIARLNRLRRSYLIRPGQRLKIPSRGGRRIRYSPRRTSPVNIRKGDTFYVVKRGDSLFQIASAHNVSVDTIKKDNNLSSNTLIIGQRLKIRANVPAGASQYTVKQGDTPYTIARQFGMNLQTLLQINALSRRSRIYPGQTLWVIAASNGNQK